MTHPGATKPKLPVGQGGIYMPYSANPWTDLYDAREQPHHKSSECIANGIPLHYADYIETAINMHDELVEALEELIEWQKTANIVRLGVSPFARARAVLTKAKGTGVS